MSIFASLLRGVYRLTGTKKAFTLPESEILKVIEKQNRHRGVFAPTDRKAHYQTIDVGGFPCLIVRENPQPARRAILYFFGGGMVIGPDRGDLPVMRKLCRETGCDVWFPFYPLCTDHCITETYDMAYACYRQMIDLYGGGNVSTCGFSSGGALALGVAAHNNAQPAPLPPPRHIVAVSPGEVPWNDAEKARMQALNEKDVAIVKQITPTTEKEDLLKIARQIEQTLHTELFIKTMIGIGTVASHLRELADSYKEAQVAIEVGKVFENEKPVIHYDNLGIGRIIYQLPTTLCEMFLSEAFKKNPIEALDEDTLDTINRFFENNLNVSETARKLYVHRNTLVYRLEKVKKITGLDLREFEDAILFKVAVMVKKYLDSQNTAKF